jgi:hypothetical protein
MPEWVWTGVNGQAGRRRDGQAKFAPGVEAGRVKVQIDAGSTLKKHVPRCFDALRRECD